MEPDAQLDLRPARVLWEDGTEIGDIDAAVCHGWLYLRTQYGRVTSYPPDRVASVVWNGPPSSGS